jgi:hypothetical protein
MKIFKTLNSAMFCVAIFGASGAKAKCVQMPAQISVADPYFNMFPGDQTAATYLNLTDCGNPGCAFSDNAVVGWNDSVTGVGGHAVEGQWQIGNLPATGSFNSDPVPGENIVLRSINATTNQTVSATAIAGVTYTLDVAFGFMTSQGNNATADLIVNGHKVLATPLASYGLTQTQMQRTGNWYDFQASYTATVADAGMPIEILLGESGGQWGMFGNVRLTDPPAAPEPATWAMMLIGFGGISGAAVMRRSLRRRSAVRQPA